MKVNIDTGYKDDVIIWKCTGCDYMGDDERYCYCVLPKCAGRPDAPFDSELVDLLTQDEQLKIIDEVINELKEVR